MKKLREVFTCPRPDQKSLAVQGLDLWSPDSQASSTILASSHWPDTMTMSSDGYGYMSKWNGIQFTHVLK